MAKLIYSLIVSLCLLRTLEHLISVQNKIANISNLDYELIDSGNQRKLERFGAVTLDRPEVSAKWPKKQNPKIWQSADAYFFEEKGKKGHWKTKAPLNSWEIKLTLKERSLSFLLDFTAFKHIGLFPEQAENWNYMAELLPQISSTPKVLNLFAYTSAASILAATYGAEVTNIDSIKQVVNWGRNNARRNEIDHIRWIVEDARKFVTKALKRGEQYHGIILDPPAFGYGAKKEVWKVEKHLFDLVLECIQLLNPDEHFFILNTYSPKMNADHLRMGLLNLPNFPRQFELGMLQLESKSKQLINTGNLLRFTNVK